MAKNLVKIPEIVDYWSRHEDECALGVDWSEAHELCWRCGYKSALQRCHIIPESLGGLATPSNLVLLCGRCHREAPNVQDPRFMWLWLRATCVPLYDTYWTLRGFQEFERMFGRKPFQFDEDKIPKDMDLPSLFRNELMQATIHFGEGRMNPSTIACIFARIEEAINGEPLRPRDGSADSQYFMSWW